MVRLGVLGTFDNFNMVVGGVRGSIASGSNFIYDTLMAPSLDEVSDRIRPAGRSREPSGGFFLGDLSPARRGALARRQAGDARGRDLLASRPFKKHDPQLGAYYRHVVKAEKTGERDVTFTFDGPGNRELPQIVGQLNVLPKHWWEGTDASGKKRDVGATTLEPPLGNGAYRIKEFVAGRTVVFERVKDYWGKDLNVNIGRDNFDEMRYRIFPRRHGRARSLQGRPDRLAHREQRQGLGDRLRFPGGEGQARRARGIPDQQCRAGCRASSSTSGATSSRTRACAARSIYAFDFEEMNKQLFFGQYQRIDSYFDGTELAWNASKTGGSVPCRKGKELEILETVRDKVPPEVFTTPYTNPVGGSAGGGARQSARGAAPAARKPATRSATASSSTSRPASR